MKLKIKNFLFVSTIVISACNEEQPKDRLQTKDMSKEGAVETQLSVEHLDSAHDILITTHKVWKQNMQVNEIVYRDTLPTLGTMIDEESSKTVNKDYELYITVK
jgi:hypothetical protein